MSRKYQYLLCLLLAVMTPLLIITPEYFPYAGLATSFVLLSTFIFFAKKGKSLPVVTTFIFILMLSVFLVLRANPMLTFLNIVMLVYLVAILVLLPKIDSTIEVILSPLATFLKILPLKHHFKIRLPLARNHEYEELKSSEGVRGTYFSIFLTFFLFLLICL